MVEVCSSNVVMPSSLEQSERDGDGAERSAPQSAKHISRLDAVKELLESKGFNVIVENQESGISPFEGGTEEGSGAFLHFTPREACLFYVYGRRI